MLVSLHYRILANIVHTIEFSFNQFSADPQICDRSRRPVRYGYKYISGVSHIPKGLSSFLSLFTQYFTVGDNRREC
jgi:hypothetical protein